MRVSSGSIRLTCSTLQAQVSLKSRATACFPVRRARAADDRRGRAPQRRRRLGAALLRGARADRSERAGSGHRRYPRSVLRRIAFIVFAQRVGLTLDEIGAELAKLPARPRADQTRLVAPVAQLDGPDRRADRRARAPQARPDRVHRLRLPVARALQARQPGRPRGPPRARPALLGRRPAARRLTVVPRRRRV